MSYVESATLRVIDQSTGPIRKIRKELAALHKEARALKSSLAVNSSGVSRSSKAAKDTAQSATAMSTAADKINKASLAQARVMKESARAARDIARMTGVRSGSTNPLTGMRGAIAASRAAERAEKERLRTIAQGESLKRREAARVAREERAMWRERDRMEARAAAAKRRDDARVAREERAMWRERNAQQTRDNNQRRRTFAQLDRDFSRLQRENSRGGHTAAPLVTPAMAMGGGGGGRGGRRSGIGSVYGGFPGNIMPMGSLYAGYATIHGVKTVIIQAANAILERSDTELQDRLRGFTPAEIERNREVTRQNAALFPQLSETEQRGSVRQLVTLMGGKSAEDLQAVAKELARGQAAVAGLKGNANAQRFAEQSVKILDRLNLTNREDAINALRAMTQGQLLGEKDLSFQQVLNNFRNAGSAVMGMSPDAMFNLIMAVDEAGLQAARNLRTFSEGMMRGTLQPTYRKRLEATGLGHGMTLQDPTLFQKDPYKWVETYVPNALKKAGYDITGRDLNDPKELVKLRAYLDKVGFLPTSLNFPLLALQQREARARQFEAKDKMNLSPVERPWESIALTTQAIANSFRKFAAELTPIADNLIAPQLFKISTAFQDMANGMRPWVDSIVQDGVKVRDVLPFLAGGAALTAASLASLVVNNPKEAVEAGTTAAFGASVLTFSAAVNRFAAAQAVGTPGGGKFGLLAGLTVAGTAAYQLYNSSDAASNILNGSATASKNVWDWMNPFGGESKAVQSGVVNKLIGDTSDSLAAKVYDWAAKKIGGILDTDILTGSWRDPKNPANKPINFNDWNFVAREGFGNPAEQLKLTMDEGSAFMRGEIKGGVTDSVPALAEAGTQFGTNAATSMNGWASEFGRIAGAAFQSSVGAINIDLSSASNTPDVGANINSVR